MKISASVTLTKQKGSIRGGISISIITIGISIIMILSSIISIRQHCFADWNSEFPTSVCTARKSYGDKVLLS